MEDLLDDLLIGSRTREIFSSFYQETFKVSSQDFSNLLLQVSQEFSAEIEGIEYYFSSETNIIDELDFIDPE
jgi:hypothetical protein